MAQKIYQFVKDSMGYKAVLPSGLSSLTGVMNMRIKIKKPDDSIIMKNMVDTDIITGTLNVGVLIGNGDLSQEGIYDYEVADTTSGKENKGKLLQFTVTREIQ